MTVEAKECKHQHTEGCEKGMTRCKLYADQTLWQIEETAEVSLDACRYCLQENKPNELIECNFEMEPFKTINVKTRIERQDDVNCVHNKGTIATRLAHGTKDLLYVLDCDHPDHCEPTNLECKQCKDRKNRPLKTSLVDSIFENIPKPRQHPPKEIKKWAVGVTTAHRNEVTVNTCIDDLKANGWNPIIFSEANGARHIDHRHADIERVVWPDTRHLTLNNPQYFVPDPKKPEQKPNPPSVIEGTIGAFANWILAMSYLVQCEPDADAYLLMQDDMQVSHFTKQYLERSLWPDSQQGFGFLSIYTSAEYKQPRPGWYEFHATMNGNKKTRWTWGACGLVFSPLSIREFLSSKNAQFHRLDRINEMPRHGTNKLDVCVGCWARDAGKSVWFIEPSLTQHIGRESAIWTPGRNNASGRKQSKGWIGEVVGHGT